KMPPQIECANDTLYCYEMRNYAGPLAFANSQKAAFLHASATYPWSGGPNYNDYTTSMDAIFGVGNWDDYLYGGFNPELIFSGKYCYIYMDGGDFDANELNTLLNNNRVLIEKWVSDGGKLFLNAAPNEGGNINFGFGGVTLLYDGSTTFSDSAYVVDMNHPLIQGPSQPVIDNYS